MELNRQTIKSYLLNMLSELIDNPLRKYDFSRKKNQLIYTWANNEVTQKLSFDFAFKPRYEPNFVAHLNPRVILFFPRIKSIAFDMVHGDKWLLANAPEITLNQPIDLLAPKSEHIRWFATHQEDFFDAGSSIVKFINSWVVPFLVDYRSVEGIVDNFEKGDNRVLKQDHWFIYVAAAYILLKNPSKAEEIIKERFDRAGTREKYSSLFDYFSKQDVK